MLTGVAPLTGPIVARSLTSSFTSRSNLSGPFTIAPGPITITGTFFEKLI